MLFAIETPQGVELIDARTEDQAIGALAEEKGFDPMELYGCDFPEQFGIERFTQHGRPIPFSCL